MSAKSRNFASNSEGRPPNFAKASGVILGRPTKAPASATTKSSVFQVKGAKTRPSVTTVPRSVMKQAARIVLPKSVRLKPYSIITV